MHRFSVKLGISYFNTYMYLTSYLPILMLQILAVAIFTQTKSNSINKCFSLSCHKIPCITFLHEKKFSSSIPPTPPPTHTHKVCPLNCRWCHHCYFWPLNLLRVSWYSVSLHNMQSLGEFRTHTFYSCFLHLCREGWPVAPHTAVPSTIQKCLCKPSSTVEVHINF